MEKPMPLSGINVLDFSQVIAGPSGSMLLADLGANVTKIESLTGELSRNIGGELNPDGLSATFLTFNRNKKSIAIDLKKEQAIEIVHKLIERNDVLIESFKPGVMSAFKLDYEEVTKKTRK